MQNCVLVFEESAVIRDLCVQLLEDSGFNVDVVSSQQEAVRAAATDDYSFIIVGASNLEDELSASQQIRAESERCGKYTPIIAVAKRENRESCLAAGVDDFVQTPLSFNALRATITRWFYYSLGRRRALA